MRTIANRLIKRYNEKWLYEGDNNVKNHLLNACKHTVPYESTIEYVFKDGSTIYIDPLVELLIERSI